MRQISTGSCEACHSIECPESTFFGTRTRFAVILLVLLCLTAIWCNILTFNFAVICMHPHRRAVNGTYVPWVVTHGESNMNESMHDNSLPHVLDITGTEIIWYTQRDKSLLIAIVAIGALIANFIVVALVNRFGIRVVFSVLGLLSAFATLAIPTAARLGIWYFATVRALQGVAFAANFCVIGSFTSRWAYYKQNGLFVSALVAHFQLAPAFSMPISAALCTHFRWPSVFYVHGLFSFALFGIFAMVYGNNPHKHPMVGCVEKKKIAQYKVQMSKSDQRAIPYRAILTSPAVWAIWLAALGNFACVNLMFLFSPTYLHVVLGYPVKDAGITAAIPALLQFAIKIACGHFSDRIKCISETAKLKLFNSIAFLGSAGFLVLLAFADVSNQMYCLALLAGATGMLGLTTGGFFKSAPLISLHYSHFVTGNMAVAITVTMLLMPILVGQLAAENTPMEWRFIFLIVAGILLLTAGLFATLASGVPQDWATNSSRSATMINLAPVKVQPEKMLGEHGGKAIEMENNASKSLPSTKF